MKKILYVEAQASTRRAISELLINDNYMVTALESGKEGLSITKREQFDAILYSKTVTDIGCLLFLEKLRTNNLDIPLILLARGETDPNSITHYETNGVKKVIHRVTDLSEILESVRSTIKKMPLSKGNCNKNIKEIVGSSQQILDIKEIIKKVSHYDLRVLITGENGTGKEVVASNIHANSSRRNHPMYSVNCATLNNELADSILFGHEKGSFTGAIGRRIGYFEKASGSTLFLDEIGELSLDIQSKLLRVLETKKITRLGSTEEISVDTRVIAATNRNLGEAIKSGIFREDLYYRLNSVEIHIPALRDRCEDVSAFIDKFLTAKNQEFNKVKCINTKAINKLSKMSWRGNVRELQSAIERLVIFCDDDDITVEHIEKYCK